MLSLDATGYVSTDSKLLTSPDGENYTSFSIAVSVGTKQNPVTEWVQCIAKGKLSEISAMYIKKGVKAFVRGRPSAGSYVNSAGKTVNVLRVTVSQLEWFGTPTGITQNTNNNNLNSDLPY